MSRSNGVAPIPSMVSIANEENKKYDTSGTTPMPGMMADRFPGPLGLFATKKGGASTPQSALKPGRHVRSESPLTPVSKASPTPCLVEADDSESGGDIGSGVLWHRDNNNLSPPSLMLEEAIEKKSGLEKDDQRLVHKQTADGHYLVSSQPLQGQSMNGIKYNLNKGRKSMTPAMRQASDVSVLMQKTKPNIMKVAAKNSPRHLLNRMDGTAFKIFLLLIQPKSKIFEIIQVFYSTSASSVKDVLDMIPTNATEPALGSQEYAGLCRPQDGAVLNLDAAAKITRGEILVAIPTGFSGPFCAKISKPILSNPKVTRLLNKSDPLAPKRKKKKHRSKEPSLRRSRKTIAIATVKEETESVMTKTTLTTFKEQELLRLAMRHAAQEAATANAEVESSDDYKTPLAQQQPASPKRQEEDDREIPVELWKTTMSLRSRSTCYSRADSSIGEGSTIASEGEPDFFASMASLDDSASFSSSTLKRIPRRSHKHHHKRSGRSKKARRRQYIVRALCLVVGLMILRYCMVARRHATPHLPTRSTSMLGVASTICQVMLAFVSLYKLQLYVQGKGHPENCPFIKTVRKVKRG